MNLAFPTPLISKVKDSNVFALLMRSGIFEIPGHIDAIMPHGDIHESHAGFVKGNVYEREADQFAASLLMPNDLFAKEMRSLGDGLQAVEALSDRCITSMPAAAIRYVQKAKVPVAMLISSGSKIDYCFMSGPFKDFERLEWPHKGQPLPSGSKTHEFNTDPGNIRTSQRAEDNVNLHLWFGGERDIPGTEEIVGLGRYGKTLTILSSEIFADDEDELYVLEKSCNPVFGR